MTLHPRKSQRVYRSPSNPDDPSPYAKCASATPNESHFMDIDAEDKEAGTILMALAQHANRIRSHSTLGTIEEKPTQSRSMSIRNLLDDSNPNRASGLVSPHRSLSSGAKPFYESRRQNSLKKGIKICLAQRNTYMNEEPEEEVKPSTVYHRKNVSSVSFRHPDIVKTIMRKPTAKSIRKNTLHIHISYRIHAHITSSNSLISKSKHVETSSSELVRPQHIYDPNPSAFSPTYRTSIHNTNRAGLKPITASRRHM